MPPETLVHLGLFYGPVVAAFAIVSMWCYTHYDLSRERHAQILEELNVRRRSESGDQSTERADKRVGSAPD